MNATLGTMFSGSWGDDNEAVRRRRQPSPLCTRLAVLLGGDDQNFGNKIMTTLGLAASVYTLGTLLS